MVEERIAQQAVQQPRRPKWIWWLAGSGIALFLCAAGLLGGLLIFGPSLFARLIPARVNTPRAADRLRTSANAMGDPDAPVHMIEYGDYQCPYCLRFWTETEPRLIDMYVNTGKVYFEYRSVGAFLGPESAAAAEAAYCAGDQNRFWDFHDGLFSKWTGENVGDYSQDNLHKYAASLGLDGQAFNACLQAGTYKTRVAQDVADAAADNVHATPTFFINGQRVEGAQPFEAFQQVIEGLLHGTQEYESGGAGKFAMYNRSNGL